jgi:RNAse (barnase) inhibitor barstar
LPDAGKLGKIEKGPLLYGDRGVFQHARNRAHFMLAGEGLAMSKPIYEIDGRDFSTLEEFFDVVSHVLIPGAEWGHNLDSFNDILRGGFGTPDGGFVFRWANWVLSRERLGHAETVRQLEDHLTCCHPTNRSLIREELQRARQGFGPTVFDWLVEIIEVHGAGGDEQEDGVELILG